MAKIRERTSVRRWGWALAIVMPVLALVVTAQAQALPGLGAMTGQSHIVVDKDELLRGGTPAAPPTRKNVPTAPMDPADDQAEPGAPMPVPRGAFAYLATRSATLWLAAQRPADRIKGLPVPPQYRRANDALATQMDRELTAAARTTGACVQIIIDPHASGGNLFDYGVWSVEPQYCP